MEVIVENRAFCKPSGVGYRDKETSMVHITQHSLATLYFTLTWESSHAAHVEYYLAKDVSLIRDMLPLGVKSQLVGLKRGDSVNLAMDPSEVPPFKPGKVLDMPHSRFQPPLINGRSIKPRIGRYYPKHFIADVPGTRPDSVTPFRVVEADRAGFKANMNHPMADRPVCIHVEVLDIHDGKSETSGLKRWPEIILKGPGMQARLPETPTDFLGAEPFHRVDPKDDGAFYARPRMEHHLDSRARENVGTLYADLLKDGMNVLDLMAGHDSHLPEGLKPGGVTGLGLNAEEMAANPALGEQVIHDVNADSNLPFADATFDAVICTSSVEYLVKPFEVFEEAGRVLKPGGVFVLAFSNRWFEEKVIRIWTELHEFERMGLISQYIIRTELFSDIATWSERGWPRPDDPEDHHAEESSESDPVYAVSGIRK